MKPNINVSIRPETKSDNTLTGKQVVTVEIEHYKKNK